MADEVVTTPAPVVPAPVVATAVTPPAAVVPPAPASAADPAWLPDRIAQAKRSAEADLLKSLGFESPEAAKAAGAAAKAAADANKSAEQRAAEATTQAATSKAQADAALTVVGSHAGRQMAALSPERQTAVKAIAGDDPVKQLSAIDALLPTWGAAATATAAAVTATAIAAGASTSAAGGAPMPATTVAPDKAQTLESLEKSNPMLAATFALRNARDIYGKKTE